MYTERTVLTMFERTTLIGHVGQDPQMRYTPDGTPVTTLTLATRASVSKAKTPNCPGGWKDSLNGRNWELTTWWRITFWRKQAETVAAYVKKGMQLFVEGEMAGEAANGSLNPRVWKGADGVPRASFELTARTFKFMGNGGGDAGSAHGDEAPDEPPYGSEPDATGDLPW